MKSRPLLGIQIHIILLVITFLLLVDRVRSLELLELRVPAHVPLGTRAHLSCRWQLGPTEVLYSVKWYKDGKEFFRHVPREAKPRTKFLLPGVDVEEFDHSGTNVTLSSVTLESSGRYRCEVSGEKPLFPTVSEHADLEVIVLPDNEPTITGLLPQYSIGDRLIANCTSGRSKPATELAWYINGEPAEENAIQSSHHYKHEDSLLTTNAILNATVNEEHFKNNKLKVKCLATISPLYWKSCEKSAIRRRLNVHRDVESNRYNNMKKHVSSGYKYHTSSVIVIGITIVIDVLLLKI